MSTDNQDARPAFYTVAETARLLRVDTATIYRALRDGAFPAIRLRTRYLIPAVALDQLITQAAESGGCVDVAEMAAQRRQDREVARLTEHTGRGGRR